MNKYISLILIISLLAGFQALNAQSKTSLEEAQNFIISKQSAWNLQPSDVDQLVLTDRYKDEYSGVEHFYFQQTYKGIPIYQAVASVHLDKNGNIHESPSRFISNIKDKISASKVKVDAFQALKASLIHYNVENALMPSQLRSREEKNYFEKTNFTLSDIPVKKTYFLNKNNQLILSWDLTLDLVDRDDVWNVMVDMQTGQVIHEQNYTVTCQFPNNRSACNHTEHSNKVFDTNDQPNLPLPTTGAPTYNVIPVPIESPIHGQRKLVTNPADPTASKFGWHTTRNDGATEFTITRGNNVFAYLDRNGDNSPDLNTADGGASLTFDFPFDQNLEPVDYTKAALTNVFYVCNMVHDITYNFGFTEPAGNFQQNTYGNGGLADRVNAEAQDGSGTNNANFSTPADGSAGRMQMYQWTATPSEVSITEPLSKEGPISANRGQFGTAPTDVPIIAKAVMSDDGSSDKLKGCRNSQKSSVCKDKIVVIERGLCDFSQKAYNAQVAGALAVIIAGFDDAPINMGAGANATLVTIPTYYIKNTLYNQLRPLIDKGELTIKIVKPEDTNAGPDSLDGDFDNGIVAHEYGHGISNRLTGGPSNSGCLGNAENMGEGWSDFMSLIITAKAGDKAKDIRGIGNYAIGATKDDIGIRRRPYTTDMNINEFTYANMGTETHDIGEVWAAMLWDLYWAMADKYGFDPDFKNKNAGNNKAIQLVMDGMKLQPCSPGFVDGRNAILQADRILYNGENQCLIWNVFARRGLGFNASQGNTNLAGDEKESFESYPICVNTTDIKKSAPQIVKAGNEISYTITVRNLRAQKITDIKITDHIPVGCTYVNGSSNVPPSSVNANVIEWNIASMDSVETRTITYRFKTDPGIFSTTLWIDQFETSKSDDDWTVNLERGDGFWFRNQNVGIADSWAWQTEANATSQLDVQLESTNEINYGGNQDAALLFFHKYNTQNNVDGGFLQISEDNGNTFNLVSPSDFSINGYNGNIDYQAISIPRNKGYTGYTSDFIPSVLELKKFNGKNLKIRFRFGNDAENVPTNNDFKGWTIDDVEILKPVYYNSDACVTTSLGENNCTTLPGKGTLVDSKKVVATHNPLASESISIRPNPTNGYFRIILSETSDAEVIKLYSVGGQLLKTLPVKGLKTIEVNGSDLPKGLILVNVISEQQSVIKKLMIK